IGATDTSTIWLDIPNIVPDSGTILRYDPDSDYVCYVLQNRVSKPQCVYGKVNGVWVYKDPDAGFSGPLNGCQAQATSSSKASFSTEPIPASVVARATDANTAAASFKLTIPLLSSEGNLTCQARSYAIGWGHTCPDGVIWNDPTPRANVTYVWANSDPQWTPPEGKENVRRLAEWLKRISLALATVAAVPTVGADMPMVAFVVEWGSAIAENLANVDPADLNY